MQRAVHKPPEQQKNTGKFLPEEVNLSNFKSGLGLNNALMFGFLSVNTTKYSPSDSYDMLAQSKGIALEAIRDPELARVTDRNGIPVVSWAVKFHHELIPEVLAKPELYNLPAHTDEKDRPVGRVLDTIALISPESFWEMKKDDPRRQSVEGILAVHERTMKAMPNSWLRSRGLPDGYEKSLIV
ncbi:MAG: hypothetical protein KGH98_02805 [Candidatus Micrarchaeota archaeon]|nr:hypothetical protein [Candidatus Micrarchaeota archaeon]